MFASVIQYHLNPIFDEDFLRYWERHRDILRSRDQISLAILHQETPISYVSYVRWKDRAAFENSILKPDSELLVWQNKIDDSCNQIRILHRMNTVQKLAHNG